MYSEIAKELKNNTEIIQSTFDKFKLNIIQFVYKPYSENDADCILIIEVSSCEGEDVTENAYIKINLYDDEGSIIMTQSHYISAEDFAGYDTFEILLYKDGKTLDEAKSAKLYMSKC